MKISIVIPCRNERRHLPELLASVLEQRLEPGWRLEVLIADGLSQDGTRELLLDYVRTAPVIRIVDNPAGIVSTGLNAAIAAATGDVIIRMDAHTAYARDYVWQCVQVLQESAADNVGGPWVAKGRGIIGSAIAAAFQSRFCAGGGKAHDPDYEGEVDTVYLGCWPRAVFNKVGLFDPELVRNQDDEFNFRLRRAGGRLWQSPRIRSTYTCRASLAALFRQYMQYGFWKVAVIRKHRAIASWRHAIPALFVASIAGLAVLAPVLAGLGMTAAARFVAIALLFELLMYAAACIGAAAMSVGTTPAAAVLAVPVVIAVYQVAYGLGFLFGLLRPPQRNAADAGALPFFTALTR